MTVASNIAKKVNPKAVVKQTMRANASAANNGIFDWVKGGGQYLMEQFDNLTGNTLSSMIDESSLINGLKDTMSADDVAKTKMINIDKGQRKELSDAIMAEQAAVKESLGIDSKEYMGLNKQLENISNGQVEMNTNWGDKAKDYFGDSEKGLARAGIAMGAYGAAAIGGRYLTGGNLTTNNRGENDIAGIPFI